ncbi:HNH endonuclease [bacterium]|nr:HNH endonuclease [bacterium]
MLHRLWNCLPVWLRPRYVLAVRERASQWRKLRAAHLLKEPECVACGRDKELDVHHIVPVSADPTQELNPDNLITLCSDPCHIVFGHFFSYRCYNKDVRSMATAYRAAMTHRICR